MKNKKGVIITVLTDYADKLNYYQQDEYKTFLKQKNVLDAWQFLHSSLLYFIYAITTQKLFEDAASKCSEESRNPLYNNIEILGWNYPANTILNKFAFEWIAHISNSLDCFLQYVNAALNLGLSCKSVTCKAIKERLYPDSIVFLALQNLFENDRQVAYIRSIYNYGTHTADLFGGFFFPDLMNSKRNIIIPDFKFNGNIYRSKTIVDLFNHYEEIIKNYLGLLDAVDTFLNSSLPVPNRMYIGGLIVDGQVTAEAQTTSDLVVNVQLDNDKTKAIRYWIENQNFTNNQTVEIMPYHTKIIGTHFEQMNEIEVINNGEIIGKLTICHVPDRSILAYHKYTYQPV